MNFFKSTVSFKRVSLLKMFQESVAAESDSSDIFHKSSRAANVVFLTRTAPFFSP